MYYAKIMRDNGDEEMHSADRTIWDSRSRTLRVVHFDTETYDIELGSYDRAYLMTSTGQTITQYK